VLVVALVDDLMDRSRLTAAIPDATYTRDPAAAAGADVVVVDLARHGSAVAAVREAAPDAYMVTFGPHVDDTGLDRARADGADVVVARSVFFRDPAAQVLGRSADRRPE
jgi:2-phospho-L-lactate guanylyltransferase (CobY/MobA/RfbA family)